MMSSHVFQPGLRPGHHRWPMLHSFTAVFSLVQVRQAAFQSLGPFISTFANPSRAGLYLREDGALSIRPLTQDFDSGFASGSPAPSSGGNTSPARYALARVTTRTLDVP